MWALEERFVLMCASHINTNRTTLAINNLIWLNSMVLHILFINWNQTCFRLHIQFFASFHDCQLFGRYCDLIILNYFLAESKRHAHPAVEHACIWLPIASWELTSGSDRDFRLPPFSIPISCRIFCGIIMSISSYPSDYYNTSLRGRIFRHFRGEEKRSALAVTS